MTSKRSPRRDRASSRWFWMMLAFLVVGLMGAVKGGGEGGGQAAGAAGHAVAMAWHPFSFWDDPSYSTYEQIALILNVVIALLGLGYAAFLVKEVFGADIGTARMQEIARAVREGAIAYL